MPEQLKDSHDFFEFAKILGQQTDFKQVVSLVANKTALLLKADYSLILMLNPDTRKTIKTIFTVYLDNVSDTFSLSLMNRAY